MVVGDQSSLPVQAISGGGDKRSRRYKMSRPINAFGYKRGSLVPSDALRTKGTKKIENGRKE